MTGDRLHAGARRPDAAVPTSGAPRIARGAAVGASAMGLALAGHLAAGGSLPRATAATALLALSVAVGIALSGRRWTVSALLMLLLGVQVVFHVVFADHPSNVGSFDPADPAGHHAAHTLSGSMMLAHLLAAVIAALLLRRGESWCWQLLAVLSRPLQAARVLAAPLPLPRPARPFRPASGRLPVLRCLQLAESAPRRGPPALLAR